MDVLPARARPAPDQYRATTAALLLLAAVSHAALGVHEGLFDGGDYSLLFIAAPLMLLTVLAAACSACGAAWMSLGLTLFSLVVAFLLIGVYLIGLFHLPQAVFAMVVAARALARQ